VSAARTRGARTKDPRGGLTAAGRAAYGRTEGAHLKPGVKKAMRDMTPDEMRRKGSWASRFYGRERLPALRDRDGKPTRFALTAAAWGEPVPRTEAAARRIAAKGRRLLDAYKRLQERAKKAPAASGRAHGRQRARAKISRRSRVVATWSARRGRAARIAQSR
jgi:hypothetical protein